MAVTTAHNGAGTGTAISITHGLTINAGDAVVALVHTNGANNTITDNNGANAFGSDFQENGASPATNRYGIFSRIAGASEPSSYAFTAASSGRWSIAIAVVPDIDATVWDVAPAAGTRATGSQLISTSYNVTAPSIDIATAGAIGLLLSVDDHTSGACATVTAVGNSYGGIDADYNQSAAVASRTFASTGATGTSTLTYTGDGFTVSYVAHQVALKPAAAGTPHPYTGAVHGDVTNGESKVRKWFKRTGDIRADAESASVRHRDKVYGGAAHADAETLGKIGKGKKYSVEALADVEFQSSARYAICKRYSGDISADSEFQSVLGIGIGKRYVGDIFINAETGTLYSFTAGETIQTLVYSGEAFLISEISSDVKKTKNYSAEFSLAAEVESILSAASKKNYSGDIAALLETGYDVSKCKIYVGDNETIVVTESEYDTNASKHFFYPNVAESSVYSESGYFRINRYTRKGSVEGILSSDASCFRVKRNVYSGQAVLVAQIDGEYSTTPKAWRFEESVPGRGTSADGAFTDPPTNGGWDEYPVDGAYTQDNAYLKEYKPLRRANPAKEALLAPLVRQEVSGPFTSVFLEPIPGRGASADGAFTP